MSVERLSEQTPSSWTEARDRLEEKCYSVGPGLKELLEINLDQFDGLVARTLNEGTYRTIFLEATPEEVEMAPEAIKMLFSDLGITREKVRLFIKVDGGYPGGFAFAFAPEEITEDKVGIEFSSWGRARVEGPTERVFDGVHQYVNALFGRGERVDWLFRHLDTTGSTPHPFVVEILSQGADWIVGLVMSRKKSTSATTTS